MESKLLYSLASFVLTKALERKLEQIQAGAAAQGGTVTRRMPKRHRVVGRRPSRRLWRRSLPLGPVRAPGGPSRPDRRQGRQRTQPPLAPQPVELRSLQP